MTEDPIEEALRKNREKADTDLQKALDRIFDAGPDAATETDMAFLAARRSYLSKAQLEAFGMEEYLAKRDAVATEEEAPKKAAPKK